VTPRVETFRGAARTLRTALVNIVVFATLLVAVEAVARLAIYATRGSATAGLEERTLNLEYEPFVMFGPGWDGQLAGPPADGLPTVMLVGGSTAQGFAPEILETALAQRFARRVRVINAAYGGYNVRQEVVVAALWGGRLKPTAVTRALARRQLGAPAEYADAIPVYLEGQHSLTVIARGLDASRLMVLQPFVAFKQPLAAEERAFTAYAYRESVMRALYDQTAAAMASLARRDDTTFLDARPIFNGIEEPIFTDDVHFRTARGYELLARAIASALPDDALGRVGGAERP